jgi:hypothetical protein
MVSKKHIYYLVVFYMLIMTNWYRKLMNRENTKQ